MLKGVGILSALMLLFIAIIVIFNARGIVRKSKNNVAKNENAVVIGTKVLGYILCIISLVLLFLLK